MKLVNLAEAAQGIVQEGKQAIDGNEQHPVFDTSPESFVLGKKKRMNEMKFRFFKM